MADEKKVKLELWPTTSQTGRCAIFDLLGEELVACRDVVRTCVEKWPRFDGGQVDVAIQCQMFEFKLGQELCLCIYNYKVSNENGTRAVAALAEGKGNSRFR